MNGLIIDNFAGGGGASLGIEHALNQPCDYAINHDPEAVAMHRANHPETRHFCKSVWDVDPASLVAGRDVALGWFSPDCTYYSKARGGKPFRDRNKARRRRGLPWLVIRWIKATRPKVIMLENVEEFADWGPLLPDGKPCPIRRGMTFRRWHKQIENLGYRVDMRELVACDYGAPTSRKRLFVIARSDGNEIVFPEASHGPWNGCSPYRTAADCIDWSIPCPSIFERKRPLADATMKRIARGIMRYVVENPEPFIVTMRGTQEAHIDSSSSAVSKPLRTISASGTHHALVMPHISRQFGKSVGSNISLPLGTVTAGGGGKSAIVAAFLAKHYGGNYSGPGIGIDQPFATVTCRDHHALVTAFLLKYYGTDQDPRLEKPLDTITTKDRFGLVMVHGEPHRIVDIGMRMLSPRELYRAQSFPDTYAIDPDYNGKPLTKTAQVRMCGNSVPPVVAEALVRSNVVDQQKPESEWKLQRAQA